MGVIVFSKKHEKQCQGLFYFFTKNRIPPISSPQTDPQGRIVVNGYAGNLLGSWLTARLLDKNNPFILSGISLLSQAVCFIFMCLTSSILLLALILLILGITGYVYLICNNYLIINIAGNNENKRASAISLLHVSQI